MINIARHWAMKVKQEASFDSTCEWYGGWSVSSDETIYREG